MCRCAHLGAVLPQPAEPRGRAPANPRAPAAAPACWCCVLACGFAAGWGPQWASPSTSWDGSHTHSHAAEARHCFDTTLWQIYVLSRIPGAWVPLIANPNIS